MENILNMEYSLNAIQYLVELQMAEGQQSDFIHFIKTYPFCDVVEYKKEVFEYLIKYNNDTLNKILANHREICNDIVEKWNNELRFMKVDIGTKEVLHYNIYCKLKKDTNFPFEELYLIRERLITKGKKAFEQGNCFIEDNRYWKSIDEYALSSIYNKKGRNMTFNLSLATFANNVKSFLDDHVTEIETLQTQQPPQQTIQENELTNETKKRAINVTELEKYFCPAFKGMGNSINYFEWFVEALETERTQKEFAQIAALCYNSGQMNNKKPNTFKSWYKIFCECVGCEIIQSYTPNKLKNPKEQIKKQFNYL